MSDEDKIIKKLLDEPKIESKTMTIIKDKRQYSIRVPKDFVEVINEISGDISKFGFKFTLKIPSIKSKDTPSLTGELVYEK